MEEIMKFVKKPGLLHAAVFFAGLLSVPAIAQQEVSPDHFDDKPAVAHAAKAAAPKSQTVASRSHRTATTSTAQAKPKTEQSTVLKADAGKGAPAPR
jgi:hypothetical protein